MQFINVRNILSTFLIISTLVYAQDDVTLSFGTVDDSTGTMEILMDSSEDVYGFQFNLTGVNIISAEAGDIVPGDWMLSASDDLVLAFSLMATYIPAGSGVAVNITYEVTDGDVCLENGVVSGAGGTSLSVGYGDCLGGGDDFVVGCNDMDAINYDADADGCSENDPADFSCCEYDGGDEQVTLSFGTVDEGAGTMEILMDNSEDVYGFQFNITGVNIISAVAGGIVPGDWMLSASDDLVLGFSLMATFIPAGSGVLVNITFEGTGGDVCIEEGVISGAGGSPLTVGYGGCLEAEPEPSEVSLSFSGYADGVLEVSMTNTVDVAGIQIEIISNDLENMEVDTVYGGTSGMYLNMVTFSNPDGLNGGRILGFSLDGTTIPPGSDVLMNVEISFEGGSGTVEFSGVQFSDNDANPLTLDIGGPIAVSGGGGEDMDVTGNWAADSAMAYMDYMGEWMPIEGGAACDPFEEDGEMHWFMPNLTLILNDEGAGSWNEFCLDEAYMWDLFWSVSGDQLTLDFQGCNEEDDCPFFSDLTVVYVDEMHMQLSVVVEFEDEYYPGETQTVMFVLDYSSIDELVEGCTDSYASNYDDSANIPCDDCCEYEEVETHYNVELDDTGEFQLVIFEDGISILDEGDEIGVFDANGVVESCDMDSLCSDPIYGDVLVGAGIWTGDQLNISAIMSIDLTDFNGPILNGAIDGNPVVVKIWDASEGMEYMVTEISWTSGSGHFGDLILAAGELELQPPHFEVDLDDTGEFQLVIFEDSISILEPGDEVGVFDANGVIESCDMDTMCADPSYGEVLVGAGAWTGGQLNISAIMSIDLTDFNGPILNGAIDGNDVLIKVWKAVEEMEYTVTATWSSGSGVFGDLILATSELEVVAESDPTVVINEFFFRATSGTSVPDYVELHNFGEEDVNLSGWTLNGDPLSGTIPAGGYLLVAGEDAFFNADGDELYAGEDIPNSVSVDINLSTSSDEIVLVDGNGVEIDLVAYNDDDGWMVGNDYRGHALELMNPSLDNNDPTSWASVSDDCESDLLYGEDGSDEELANFGSPTEENCSYDESLEIEDFNIPVDYSFTAAYPNPFNPVTTLSYALPVTGRLNISVFDMQGREITVLSDGIKQAGNYSLVWDASGLPSGLYFITLQAQGFNATQKVTLIK